MQELEASNGVASTGTNATNTTNTATRMVAPSQISYALLSKIESQGHHLLS
jgi:hypothetical protein